MSNIQFTLRAARTNCGLTLKQVAVITDRSPETIGKYEVDSTNIPRDLMAQLLDIYKMPYELIFFGSESSFHGFIRNLQPS
jgi:transcriptional regulator with XRE-family HTH domain